MRVYAIATERFGVVLKQADTIDDARAWARTALGASPRAVSKHTYAAALAARRCTRCDSTPCCCRRGDRP